MDDCQCNGLCRNGFTLGMLQKLQAEWSLKNFGEQPPHRPLLGATEELGELCHAHLKMEQGIRGNEDHEANIKDAVADVIIYLSDYCTKMGINLHDSVFDTWAEVSKRDWKADPEKGGTQHAPTNGGAAHVG